MNCPFFTPKTLGFVLVGGGAMGGGGGVVYLYQMPKTWQDLLIKEGFVFLEKEDEYKGMFHDQKATDPGKGENDIKDAQESNVKNKVEAGCKGKFSASLPSSSSKDYSTTKQKLIDFCTTEGIKTVKARIIQSKKGQNGIAESNEDDKGKTVFAVYRYNSEFINGLNKDDSSNENLSKESKPSEKYSRLQNACKKLLKKNGRDIKDSKHFNYASGWCVDLGYTTIEEKIKKSDSSGSAKSPNDTNWDNLKNKWASTEQVKKGAQKAKGSNDSNDDELSEEGLKALCKSDEEGQGVKAKLLDDDSYQEKYLIIKSVCRSSNESSK